MTLQLPTGMRKKFGIKYPRILCHKCSNPVTFSKDHIAPSGRKIPLEPNTNNEPHLKYCMYANLKDNPHTEALFIDFLSLVTNKERPRRIIGAVGKAR